MTNQPDAAALAEKLEHHAFNLDVGSRNQNWVATLRAAAGTS